jgi:hypothetical protein
MKQWLLIGIAAAGFAAPAYAQGDALVEGAKLCTRHMPHYERQYGIPNHLLSAIASTESGRYHQGLKINVPWPWTINAEGKGYYFDTKQEAVLMAIRLRAKGVKSMDVGCMQVNLYHHSQAFASLEEAFDPQTNVAYAASFLRGLYQESGTWKQAASHYHSKTPSLGGKYVGLVYNSWYKIVDKLRSARVQIAENEQAEAELARVEPAPRVAEPVAIDAPATTIEVASNTIAQDSAYVKYVRPTVAQDEVVAQEEPVRPTSEKITINAGYSSPRMNSIQVSTRDSNGVIVVKPAIRVVDTSQNAPVIHVAQAHTDAVVTVSPRPARPGPNFIFND